MTAAQHVDSRVRPGEPEFAREADAVRWRTARRAALDHVLALVAGAWWSDNLVLRGSMLLHTWLPDRAREPGDLDWVAHSRPGYSYLYGNLRDLMQAWPVLESHGLPDPDDQTYLALSDRELDEPDYWWLDQLSTGSYPYHDLVDRIRRRPMAAGGVFLDADGVWSDDLWSHQEYDLPGVQLIIPWRLAGLPPGEVQVDFAHDESLPDAPLPTLIPRADGGKPTVVHGASRQASLAWKLLWLHHDSQTRGTVHGKDLYDATLLAEDPRTNFGRDTPLELSADQIAKD